MTTPGALLMQSKHIAAGEVIINTATQPSYVLESYRLYWQHTFFVLNSYRKDGFLC
jgi:hypothetical protein